MIGNAAQMQGAGVNAETIRVAADERRHDGASVILIATDSLLAGYRIIIDPVRAAAKATIAVLRDDGLRIVTLTGDNQGTADRDQPGSWRAGLGPRRSRPVDEARIVSSLQAGAAKLAMAGDGINDAPALAAADVGIAMGTGADVAIESAGMPLVGGDLSAIVRARKLARATMCNIRQNLLFSILLDALGVPIAAGELYPLAGLLRSPMVAGGAMALSLILVVLNTPRLRTVSL